MMEMVRKRGRCGDLESEIGLGILGTIWVC